ncbi:MAG TPA: Rieske 2Fe-2S domain-containing protein [Candidatus Limnocylindrales bacterium]
MAHLFARLIGMNDRWAKPFGEFNHRWVSALFRPIRPVKDLLNGTWLGHPLHAVVTDVPIGALTLALVLDLFGQPVGADIAILVGVLTMVASAVVGLADYADTDGTARTRATLHASLMVVALLVYVASLAIRAGGPHDRTVAVLLSWVGFAILAAGGLVGGEVVFAFGNMVNRHAWRGGGVKWIALELDGDGEIPEGRPTKARLGINPLVLIRQGETILALHDQCAHAGGPLSGGTIADGAIECPWHGSRFRITDGRLRRGPAVYDQPSYEIRRAEHGWEGRRAQA